MAATLSLNGRILTLTDGTSTSSVDLSNIRGDMGPRGPQGSVSEEEVRQWISDGLASLPSAEEVSY
jgi:hypothetical protein